MFALIHKGKIVQIEDAEFPVAPDLSWTDTEGVNPAPQVGWEHKGGKVFTAPPAPLPEQPAPDRAEESIRNNIGLLALVREIAENRGITEHQMFLAIRSRAS